jgi:hypothetical protein
MAGIGQIIRKGYTNSFYLVQFLNNSIFDFIADFQPFIKVFYFYIELNHCILDN